MSDVKFTVEAVLDTKESVRAFSSIQSAGDKTAKQIQSSFSGNTLSGLAKSAAQAEIGFSSLGSRISGFALPLIGLTSVVGTLAAGFRAMIEAERAALEINSFNEAAKQAGINSEQLIKQLDSANGGLSDLGDITLIASQGLNQLGSAAQSYPQLLQVARQATIQFGGDVTSNFQKLNDAILSGQTRSLKSIGIYVDSKYALDNYANSIGVSVQSLTQQERSQAILNATLEKASSSYRSIDINSETLAIKIDRLKVSFGLLTESIGESLISLFGQDLKTFSDEVTTLANTITQALTPDTEIFKLQKEIKNVQDELKYTTQLSDKLGTVLSSVLLARNATTDAENLQAKLDKLNKRYAELINKSKQVSSITIQDQVKGLSEEEKSIQLDSQKKLNERIFSLNQEARLSEIQAQLVFADENKRVQLEVETLRLQHEQRLNQIQKDNQELRFVDYRTLEQLEITERERFLSQVNKITLESEKRQTEEKKKEKDIQIQITRAFEQASVNVISLGIQAIGASLIQGGAAFANFGGTVLNIVGDLMINVGQAILAAQIAAAELFKSLVNPANAFGGIASAVALIALGGALKAVAGANAGSSSPVTQSPSPTFGGGVTDTGGDTTYQPRQDDLAVRKNDTQVQVVINGDVLDSEQSGIRIVEMINNAFDKQGVTVRRGAMA